MDFPGGAVDRNPSANAGNTGSFPDLGRFHIPQSNQVPVPRLLSSHSRACEPQLLKPWHPRSCCCNHWSLRTWSLCSTAREAMAIRNSCTIMKRRPCLSQLEKSPHSNEHPAQTKNKNN